MCKFTEFQWWKNLLLNSDKPSVELNKMRNAGEIAKFPELDALIGCEQNARWHPEGDVWNHTMNALDEYVRLRNENMDDNLLLGFAVLCHDFGKPISSFIENGEIRAHGHDIKSEKPVTRFLKQLKADDEFIDRVVALTKSHMRVFGLYDGQAGEKAIRKLMREVSRVDLLIKLNYADECGRGTVPDNAGAAGKWLETKVEQIVKKDAIPKPLLYGNDLIKLGVMPGKNMGILLKKIYNYQIKYNISDRKKLIEILNAEFLSKS